jgi:predicted deacylase
MPFLGIEARPGEVVLERVPVGELSDGTAVTLPVARVSGARAGPTLYVQAGQHGDEQTGIENCRTFLASIDPTKVAGTLLVIPVVNVPAHITRTRGFLHEERWLVDMNRVYPGNPDGLLSERIAATVFNEFVRHADLTIDMHSALEGCDIVPFASVDPDVEGHAKTLGLRERVAHGMGLPYVYYPRRDARETLGDMSRALGAQADRAGKSHVSLEMGQSRLVSWNLVPIAVRALHNAMRVLGMEEGDPVVDRVARRFSKFNRLHVNRGGGLRLRVDLGDELEAGQAVGEIVDVFGRTIEELRSPSAGFVGRVMRLGAVATGAEAIWVAA